MSLVRLSLYFKQPQAFTSPSDEKTATVKQFLFQSWKKKMSDKMLFRYYFQKIFLEEIGYQVNCQLVVRSIPSLDKEIWRHFFKKTYLSSAKKKQDIEFRLAWIFVIYRIWLIHSMSWMYQKGLSQLKQNKDMFLCDVPRGNLFIFQNWVRDQPMRDVVTM